MTDPYFTGTSCVEVVDKPNAQQRIEEAIAYGIRTKKAFNPRDWCESAGIAGGTLATFKTRFGRGDQERLSYDVAEKLAAFLGISVAWLHAGKGEMLDASTTPAPQRAAPPDPGDRLVLEIGKCQNEKLREALMLFWFETRGDSAAPHAITHFLYGLDHKNAGKLSVEQWTQEIKSYALRCAKGLGVFGSGARPMGDD